MSDETSEVGHGNSPAAWTAVIIMLVAFSVGTVAFFFDVVPVVWISAAFVLVGLIAGQVLARMGYGANSTVHEAAKDHQPGAR